MAVRPGGLLVADALAELVSASGRSLSHASVGVLRQVPLFAGLSDRHLRRVAKLATVARFRPNVAVVREARQGHTFFVILEGRAEVRRGARTTELVSGDYFGEMALLDRGPRSATVTTQTETTVLRIAAAPFHKLLRSEPTIAIALLETLSLRIRELERQA
jgi:CRP-like cAMP-binding protein